MALILQSYTPKGFTQPISNVYVTLTDQKTTNFKKGTGRFEWWVYESQDYYNSLKNNTETVANPNAGQTGEPDTIEVSRPLHGDINRIIGTISIHVSPDDFNVIASNTSGLSEATVRDAYIKAIYEWALTKPPFNGEGVTSVTE